MRMDGTEVRRVYRFISTVSNPKKNEFLYILHGDDTSKIKKNNVNNNLM